MVVGTCGDIIILQQKQRKSIPTDMSSRPAFPSIIPVPLREWKMDEYLKTRDLMNYPAAELRGIKGVKKSILYWKGTRRFPFQTNPFLIFHPAAKLRGILLIKI
jgi:hypothetical protein